MNHLALQYLALRGSQDQVLAIFCSLPSCAPRCLVGISIQGLWDISRLLRSSDPKLEIVDRALSSDSQYPHLKSVEFDLMWVEPVVHFQGNFRQGLPKCYERGVLWINDVYHRMFFILIRPFVLPSLITTLDIHHLISPEGAPRYAGLPLEWEIG